MVEVKFGLRTIEGPYMIRLYLGRCRSARGTYPATA